MFDNTTIMHCSSI